MPFNNEIEEMKAQIQVLQNKLEELEKRPSPAEEAFKEFYGAYPITDIADTSWDSDGWVYFEAGYNAAYKEKVSEEPEEQKWDAVRESVKWCEEHPDKDPLDCLKPQTPEQTSQSLKEAFREAQQTEKWKEIQKLIDEEDNDKNFKNSLDLIKEWGEKNKPPTLYQILWEWWEDLEDTLNMENSIQDLVNDIEEWLPKEQSAQGSQNVYVECTVEGFNDCLNKIKGKLR